MTGLWLVLEFDVSGIETDYDALAAVLEQAGAPLALAEIHGGLCGVICAGGRSAAAGWLDELVDDGVGDAESRSRLAAALDALADSSWRALSGMTMEFTPLLPGDDADLDQRAQALGHWCHGFLAGLIVGGVALGADSDALSVEMRELVDDMAAISRAGVDPAEAADREAGDRAYFELVEFVRVGAQYVFEDLLPDPAPERTIH